MSDTANNEEDPSPANMDIDVGPTSGEDAEKDGGGDGGGDDVADGGIDTGDLLTHHHDDDQETAKEDTKVNEGEDARDDENHSRGQFTDMDKNLQTTREEEKEGDDGGGGGEDEDVGEASSTKIDDTRQGDTQPDGAGSNVGEDYNLNHSGDLSPARMDNDAKLDGAGDDNTSCSNYPGDSPSTKTDNNSQAEETNFDDADDDSGDGRNENTEETLETNNLQTFGGKAEGGSGGGFSIGNEASDAGNKQINRSKPEKRLQTSKSLDISGKENLSEGKLDMSSITSSEIRREISERLSGKSKTINSPQVIPNGAVHALTEIAKTTKHGTRESTIQNRQVMSVKAKNYPDRSAQRLLRQRRDRVIESLMRKDAAQRNDAAYAYGKFSPIRTDKLPEFKAAVVARGGLKKSPLFNLMNEPFNVAINKRTLERRRLKLSKEIAALDMLPEANMIKPDELLKTVVNDANTTARSSLLGKVRERKLRSETKKELQLRRRKMPRMSEYNRFSFELSSTSYRPKLPMTKVLPKLGQCPKKEGKDSTSEPGDGEIKKGSEQNQQSKKEGKHVSFGPICILNIDEEFAMFVQANGRPFRNTFRAKLRRQQATDNGFAGGKYGQLSPVPKQAKSTITDRSFSTEEKQVPQFTAKPIATLPKIRQAKPENKPAESTNPGTEASVLSPEDKSPEKQPLIEKKPQKSILKIAKYQGPDMTLNVKCSPEFRAIMDSLHGVNPSPFLLK